MNDEDETLPRAPIPSVVGYESPKITRLGTLAELTQGGGAGPDDGLGGAGDEGSV